MYATKIQKILIATSYSILTYNNLNREKTNTNIKTHKKRRATDYISKQWNKNRKIISL